MPDYRILIADYEPRGIHQLRDPLDEAGFQVEVVKDGLQAIETFQKFKPHLTLLEAMLPKKHGFEVCHEIKSTPHGQLTPVVIVTSVYKGRKYRTQAIHHYGCDEYLEKPVAPDVLLGVVQRLIGQSRFLDEGTAEPPAAGPDAAAAASPPADEAEFEIMERLNEILPGGSGSGDPQARAGDVDHGAPGGRRSAPGFATVVSLELERQRRMEAVARGSRVDGPPESPVRAAVNAGGHDFSPVAPPRPRTVHGTTGASPIAQPAGRTPTGRTPPDTGSGRRRLIVMLLILAAALLVLFFGPF